MTKPVLCLDFDGVVHSYTSGWQGANVVADPPVPGAIDFLREAVRHFEVHVFSSRSHQEGGGLAMRTWLGNHILAAEPGPYPSWFAAIRWPTVKPPAVVTLDDRALTFTGLWPSMGSLLAFKPWYGKTGDGEVVTRSITRNIVASRVTTESGQGELTLTVHFNAFREVDVPNLEEGDLFEVTIRRIGKGG